MLAAGISQNYVCFFFNLLFLFISPPLFSCGSIGKFSPLPITLFPWGSGTVLRNYMGEFLANRTYQILNNTSAYPSPGLVFWVPYDRNLLLPSPAHEQRGGEKDWMRKEESALWCFQLWALQQHFCRHGARGELQRGFGRGRER